MTDLTALRDLYDQHMRRHSDFSDSVRQDEPSVVRYVNQKRPRSNIRYSRLSADNADAVIQREIDYFTGLGHRFEWTVFDYDAPPDLRDRLAAHGFTIGEVEIVMVLDITNLPDKLERAPSHDIRQLAAHDAVLGVLDHVQEAVFDKSHSAETAAMIRDHPDEYQFFAAYVDDEPVSAAWIDYIKAGSPFAGLYGGATLPAHRGKGIYTALVAARANAARSRGVRYLTVDASPMSHPILERIGFQALARAYPCDYVPR
jgi:GNAT superfamily N-acetyltransferase